MLCARSSAINSLSLREPIANDWNSKFLENPAPNYKSLRNDSAGEFKNFRAIG
jgi:hypothetical protein